MNWIDPTLFSPGVLPWIVAVGVAAGCGVWLGGLDRSPTRRGARTGTHRAASAPAYRRSPGAGVGGGGGPINVQAAMLADVAAASFRPQRLLNQAERRVLSALDAALDAHAPDWRAMAQVNLGEILSSPDERAYRAINAKRVDLLVVDAQGWPVVAIEYQGSGHYLSGDASLRDAVKREALRRAGVPFEEVRPDHDAADIDRIIRRARTTVPPRPQSAILAKPRPDPIPPLR